MNGRALRAGLDLAELDLGDALAVIYSFVIDDARPTYIAADGSSGWRREDRARFDRFLETPSDPEKAKQYERDRWGEDDPDAIETERRLAAGKVAR